MSPLQCFLFGLQPSRWRLRRPKQARLFARFLSFLGRLQSHARGHFSSLTAVWSLNNDLLKKKLIQFFLMIDRKTVDSTQEVWFTEGIDGAGNRALTTINWNCFYCCLYFFFYCVKVLTCKLPVNLWENIQTLSQSVSFQVFWKGSITANVFKQWCCKAELKWPVRVLEEISFLKSVLSYVTILLAYLSTGYSIFASGRSLS